jgi:hypothetical protein
VAARPIRTTWRSGSSGEGSVRHTLPGALLLAPCAFTKLVFTLLASPWAELLQLSSGLRWVVVHMMPPPAWAPVL